MTSIGKEYFWGWALLVVVILPRPGAGKDVTLPIGEVEIVNNYQADFQIHLRHADAPEHRFATWRILSTDKRRKLVHDDKKLVIGGDWEMEIEFGSGVVSPRRIVASVGTHADGTWTMTGGDIHDGLQRSAARWVIPVLVIRYFPVTHGGQELDLRVTEGPSDQSSLRAMKEKCARMTKETLKALEEGSRFRAYKIPYTPPSLRYEITDTIDYFDSVPPDTNKRGRGNYHAILQRANARDYVERRGVKEIWIWGYHSKISEPWESNLSSPHGMDISNSDRDRGDLPIFSKTYTVYHYNYHRATEEAVHNHLHQIECLIRAAHPTLARLFEGERDQWRCGNCHFPPNGVKDYDYHNSRFVESDIEDWRPEGFGVKKPLNRDTWNNRELLYYIYWMRSLPGARNGLTYQRKPLMNWWHWVGDFDDAQLRSLSLVE